MIDSHCHLNHRRFRRDLEAVIAQARAAGLQGMLVVGYDLESSRRAVELAEAYPDIAAAVGIHPHDARLVSDEALAELRALAESPRVIAIGETGLDFYRDLSPRDMQRRAFQAQLALARELDLPAIVHDRDAHDEVVAILAAAGEVRGSMHCFSGGVGLAERVVELGWYVGIAGTVTRPGASAREVARVVPADRLLIETDAPYLMPRGLSGSRSEPAHVARVAEEIAALRGSTAERIGRLTADNARRLFAWPG